MRVLGEEAIANNCHRRGRTAPYDGARHCEPHRMNTDTRTRRAAAPCAAPCAAVCMLLMLAGCGAEVAVGAAAVGGLQAQKTRQALQQQAQVVDGLQAAQAAGLARAASAAD